jgi:dolichol-phosphate mannosyltransferase
MLAAAESRDATFVVASRYRDGGDSAGLACVTRRVLSRAASGAANALFWRALRRVSDPMSGFFLFRRDMVDRRTLRPEGFKILLEIALRTPGLRITEVPYTFEERHAGESKANRGEAVAYARHLARLRVDLARQRVFGARA